MESAGCIYIYFHTHISIYLITICKIVKEKVAVSLRAELGGAGGREGRYSNSILTKNIFRNKNIESLHNGDFSVSLF